VRDLTRTKKYYVHEVEDGIFGVALAGDEVPVRSIVSRGVKSLSSHGGDPGPATPYVVTEAEIHRPRDGNYMFHLDTGIPDSAPAYHLVRKIRNIETNREYTPPQLFASLGMPDMIGLRRPGSDGFELHVPNPMSFHMSTLVFLIQGAAGVASTDSPAAEEQPLVGANIDLFDLDGPACVRDVELKMEMLREQTVGERVLGAVMFSCAARGPRAGSLIGEDMADAKRFARSFPRVPCLGFYAGGEIGPLALAGGGVFRTGSAALQGFTAVFALFIVPPAVDLSSATRDLDDSRENTQAFLGRRLHS